MKTIIFKTASSYLLPLLLLFAIFILLRGHYLPGGGFVGGLIAAIAFVIHSFANGIEKTRGIIKFHPGFLMPIGLALALIAAIAPLFTGGALMTGLWFENPVPVIGMVGSALFFDIGVFLVVVGVTLTIIFTISETI
ncbi:Na+/H+ antiporter subunit B [Litoribacter ruber]|uniref:Na+/H+ antiporter subunit B n=1 Tax=Litoribacter ruber TaxID=702568 RepID=A0AAP2CI93_9BACT|nr:MULTISPECIES: Na+/H+ antiporter subunit B [Litoribacter]MBS9525196.1 Na+/H+ antiporter subunit B [Litoribacter alkaliphilus]MBT0811682.1 Na+/H+ antiporter subunit B [Litoribacter ruber]